MFTNINETVDGAKEGVKTDYYGTKHVIEALLPLLQSSSDGRLVNVSSDAGLLTASSDVPVMLYSDAPKFPPYPTFIVTVFLLIHVYVQFIKNEEVRQELNDIDNLTEQRIDELLDKFLEDFEAGTSEAQGWPTVLAAYKMAKAAMNAYSRILAKRHPELRVNCVHPGYVRTDITMGSGILTPEEGARNVVKVALLPEGAPTGLYFDKGEEASFV
jgi:(+)-neomenthol dehydrogenase